MSTNHRQWNMLKYTVKRFRNKLSNVEDPIEASKQMISSIQSLVGIHNVFGDDGRRMPVRSMLVSALFPAVFLYVGTLSQWLYLVQVFPDKAETFKTMNCLSAVSVPLSTYIFMWTSRSRLKTIFDLSRYGLSAVSGVTAAKDRLLGALGRGRRASWGVVLNQALTHTVYLAVPFLFTCFGNNRYLPTTPGEPFGLSPKYKTPFYEITFVLTCVATAFSAINQTGYIVLFVTLLSHELGHFYAITETLNSVHEALTKKTESNAEQPQSESVDDTLRFCVKHHQFLMHYHRKINELYKNVFGAHFLMMTVVVVTTLQTMNSWDYRNTILTAMTGIMPLFIYCFGGELLISAGLEMTAAMYACGWELMDEKQARVVLLMLHLSQKPLCLTAADMYVMNRQTFGNVAQVVYKIYAVFN